METIPQLSTNNVNMLLPGILEKHIKFVTFLVYTIDEIPAIFFKLGAWLAAKARGVFRSEHQYAYFLWVLIGLRNFFEIGQNYFTFRTLK